jgi:NAD(P)-dependent dehydrogenase (short-subunit alcohol dehydrogenase family)
MTGASPRGTAKAVAAVHLRGAFLGSRAARRAMVTRVWGRIVNLSPVSALGSRGLPRRRRRG